MTLETLNRLPEALTEPIALFKSATEENGYVAMLEIKSSKSATVILPVEINAIGPYESEIIIVRSAYAKADSVMGALLRDRLVSRRNDKKVPAPSEKGKVDEKQKNEQDGTSSTKRTSIQNAYTNRDLCHTRPRRTREIASQNLRVNRI